MFRRTVEFTARQVIRDDGDVEEVVDVEEEVDDEVVHVHVNTGMKQPEYEREDWVDEEDEDVTALPLGTSDLDIVAVDADDRGKNEVRQESVNADDTDVVVGGHVHRSPTADAEARGKFRFIFFYSHSLFTFFPVLNSAQTETTTTEAEAETLLDVEETRIALPEIPIDPALRPDPSKLEQDSQPETEPETEMRQQQNGFGLLPTPPTESDPPLEPALPGQQELADILTSLAQYDSETAPFELEEVSGMEGTSGSKYTVVEAETDDENSATVLDEDVHVVPVADGSIEEVVNDYEIEEPLTETEGRLTEVRSSSLTYSLGVS